MARYQTIDRATNTHIAIERSNLPLTNFAEGFIHANATPTVITTQNVVHGLKIFNVGHASNSPFTEGISGTISAFAEGTVPGTVKATDTAHGLTTGDIITIEGGDNYASPHKITVIDNDNFYFTDTWVSNDGAQPWTRPDTLRIDVTALHMILITFSATTPAANQFFSFHLFKDEIELDHLEIESKWQTANEVDSASMVGIDPFTKNDKVWVGVRNLSSSADITIKHGNFSIIELLTR